MTPLLPVQTISLVLGDLTCRENEAPYGESVRLRVCTASAVHQTLASADNYSLLAKYVRLLLDYYAGYTGAAYALTKIDIVVLPLESMLDFLRREQVPAQLGIVYLPQVFVENMKVYSLSSFRGGAFVSWSQSIVY